jgi:hypothetical protein
MTYPVFASGDVLNASDMNGVGLWLVKTQTVGSGVASVTVSGAFSADYDNYFVVYTGQMSVLCTINTTLGASATGYYNALQYTNFGAPGNALLVNNNATGAFTFSGVGGTNFATLALNLQGPFLAQPTKAYGNYISTTDTGTFSGIHNVATSYSSISFFASGGNFNGGTIRVYGYRN